MAVHTEFSAVPGGTLDSWSPRASGVSLRSLVVFSLGVATSLDIALSRVPLAFSLLACHSACPSTF